MIKDIRVFILDKDPFVRSWMALLLARDWRTHIAGEAGSIAEMARFIREEKARIDLVFLGADLATGDQDFTELNHALSPLPHAPLIILTGLQVDERALKRFVPPQYMGYILKEEIGYALAWAAALAASGEWVVTPGIQEAIFRTGAALPGKGMVLDGRKPVVGLTGREIEAARMAFLFSLERHDLADELNISKDWSYGLVSSIYKKLGLDEIIGGEIEPSAYLGDNPLVVNHLHSIVSQLNGSPKARDIETLAFHIFTMPEIEDF
jgi:DNA-binding NarL/FixJ family response regulator